MLYKVDLYILVTCSSEQHLLISKDLELIAHEFSVKTRSPQTNKVVHKVSTNQKKSKFPIDMKTRNKGVLIKKRIESAESKSRGLCFEPETSFPNMDSKTNDI